MSTTRKDLRQRIGNIGFLNQMIASTSTNGSPTTATLADTALPNIDGLFVNGFIVVNAGSAAGNRRVVTDYTSQVLTPDRVFSANVASGNAYEVWRVFDPTDVDEGIAEAMRLAKFRWAKTVEDTSLTYTTTTYTYSIGNLTVPIDAIADIEKIEYDTGASGTGYPYALLDDDYWSIRDIAYVPGTAATLKLQFRAEVDGIIPSGKTIRLTYRARPTVLSDETTALFPDNDAFAEYICAKCCELLYQDKANKAEESQTQGRFRQSELAFKVKADLILSRDSEPPEPGKVISPVMQERGYVQYDVSRIHIP